MFTKPHIDGSNLRRARRPGDSPLPDMIIDIFGVGELISTISHLGGACVFAVLSVYLLQHSDGKWPRRIALGVFAGSAVLLLSVSGIFHSLRPGGEMRQLMLRLDYAAIFVLIAGTYTPVLIILFKGIDRWGFLTLIWALALAGIVLKTIYFDEMSRWLTLSLYVGLGWLGIYPAYVMARQHGVSFLIFLILGGIAYTAGGVMNLLGMPILIPGFLGPHDIWHVAVLVGLACHWHFVSQIAAGQEVPRELIEPGPTPQPVVAQKT